MALSEAISEQAKATEAGDLKRSEEMLTAQAHSLDVIFNNLARRAINSEHLKKLDLYMRLALRAQSQCRGTWVALATIRNPPIAGYVKQANIAHGPQQVNNVPCGLNETPLARENKDLQKKLLEEINGDRLDFGTTCAASAVNPAMATVGKVDRAED